MTTPGGFTNDEVRVLLAVVVHRRSTFRSVAIAAGVTYADAARHLNVLRALDLVAWDHGKRGTLRPLLRPVPFGSRYADGTMPT